MAEWSNYQQAGADFFGTRESLIADGVLSDGMFPGDDPRLNRSQLRFDSSGKPFSRFAHPDPSTVCMAIWRVRSTGGAWYFKVVIYSQRYRQLARKQALKAEAERKETEMRRRRHQAMTPVAAQACEALIARCQRFARGA